ncbi:MAG: xylulokinase [Spirochaetales bacterium]
MIQAGMGCILSFDIGTSSVKAGLFDRATGEPVWLHRESFQDSKSEWVVEQWIRAVQAVCDQLPDGQLEAVSLSGNGPTVIPVREDGTALTDAMLWHDDREIRVPQAESFFLPKVAWVKQHAPEIHDQVTCYMTCPEYLAYLMGGDAHSTSPSVSFDPYVWTKAELDRYGIDGTLLPPLVRPGVRVGQTRRRGGELFGLGEGIPIFAAGPAFLMSQLGTATVEPGQTCDRAGTSEGINHCTAERVESEAVRCLPHVVPPYWNVAGILSSTGRIFEWFRSISRQRSVGYDRMLAEIGAAGIDDAPYFFPSTHEGAAWEFSQGMFVGLRSDHGTPEMGRGVVQAIGFAVRQSIESLHTAGCEVVELRASGGQAKNATWNQIKADITGIPIICPEVLDAELMGNVCCARAGLGDAASPWEAARELVRFDRRFEPVAASHHRYSEGYERYLVNYEVFLEAFSKL